MPIIALDLEAFSSSFSTNLAGRYQILTSTLLILELSSGIFQGLRFLISSSCSDCRAFRISFTINMYFDGVTEWQIYTLVLCLMRIFTEFLLRGVSKGYCKLVPPVDTYRSVDTGLYMDIQCISHQLSHQKRATAGHFGHFLSSLAPQFYMRPALIYSEREADSLT